MNSKLMMATTKNRKQQQARNIVDKVRLRVPPKKLSSRTSSSFSSVANSTKQFNRVHDCRCYTQSLIENHSNFKRSAAPARLMYYDDGSWVDFSKEVIDLIRLAFVEGKPVVETEIGSFNYLFDFYRMLQIDFEFGNQRSIAWIDVNGKCFFPKTFIGSEFIDFSGNSKSQDIEISNFDENSSSLNPKIEIKIRIGENCDSNKRKRKNLECEYREELKVEKSNGSSSNEGYKKKRQLLVSDLESPRWPKAKLLKEGEKAHSVVKNLFMSWLGVAEPGATITTIHQCTRTGPLDRVRYEVFQKQLEITNAARGDPNMTFAWHRTSSDGVANILSHGFGMPSKVSCPEAYGVGIYLSPVKSIPMSAMLSEVDDNGEKHVIFCRVILGKCEKVEAGSQQSYPSSVDFDTGVDNVNNPKQYVVWCANMNSHILPECVVSYKSAHHLPGQLNGSSFLKWVPNASNALTAKFFSKLGGALPSSKVKDLQTLCSTYKDGKVAKDMFMKQLRSVVGDEMLLSAIREIRG